MESDEQQIRRLVATWIEATKAGDKDTILGLMAEDVVFLVTGQAPMVGKATFAEAMEALSAHDQPEFAGTSEIREIRVLGDWAYMWAELSVEITPPGGAPAMTRAGHTLSILRKQDGRWVLARDANMLASAQ